MSLISVITPTYNAEKTIRETVQSVLDQTFTDFEYLIINDGSTDSTLEIISSFSDPRIKVCSFTNAGLGVSRNRGVEMASGEFITFIDSDDLWTPEKLEAQLRALQEHPKAALAYSWVDHIDASGRFFRQGRHDTNHGDVYAKLLTDDFIGGGSNALIRSKAIKDVGKFDESLTNAQDWDMWLRLAHRYPFVAVPVPQILYRQYPSSMSTNIWGMEKSSMRVIEKGFARLSETHQRLKRKALANRYRYLALRATEGKPERKRGLTAIRYHWLALKNDPSLLFHPSKYFIPVLFKTVKFILLPLKP